MKTANTFTLVSMAFAAISGVIAAPVDVETSDLHLVERQSGKTCSAAASDSLLVEEEATVNGTTTLLEKRENLDGVSSQDLETLVPSIWFLPASLRKPVQKTSTLIHSISSTALPATKYASSGGVREIWSVKDTAVV